MKRQGRAPSKLFSFPLHHKPNLDEQVELALVMLKHQNKALDWICKTLAQINKKENTMSVELDALTAQVAADITVEEGVITLIQGLAAKIESLKNDPVKLQALVDQLKAEDDKVAAAVAAVPSDDTTPAP